MQKLHGLKVTRRPPDAYRDGCSFGPRRLGGVDHNDICLDHDDDWWALRRAVPKIGSDLKWAGRIIWRHKSNWPWQVPALIIAVFGFAWMATFGWFYWAGILGPWQKYRDELKNA